MPKKSGSVTKWWLLKTSNILWEDSMRNLNFTHIFFSQRNASFNECHQCVFQTLCFLFFVFLRRCYYVSKVRCVISWLLFWMRYIWKLSNSLNNTIWRVIYYRGSDIYSVWRTVDNSCFDRRQRWFGLASPKAMWTRITRRFKVRNIHVLW